MSKRLRQAGFLFIVVFAVAQLIRPNRTNPPTDISRTIPAQVGTASGLASVLDRSGYSPAAQRTLLSASCEDVSSGKMPGPYTLVRPETKLSPQDVQTICTAARQAEANAADGRRHQ
jgi:hypothetical protein